MTHVDRTLPNWLDSFMTYTANTEPPYLYRKWTGISCIAAALQRKCRLRWGTGLTFYPNFYIVLVGPSAAGKSTAMSAGIEIVREVPKITLSSQAITLQALVKKQMETVNIDPDQFSTKTKPDSSVSVFSKEFTVFLGFHNRELMSALCDWFDCDEEWVYETRGRDKETITGVWFNLIGGTTPDLIHSALPPDSIGAGLTSRIIFVVEEKKDKLITLPIQTKEEVALKQWLIEDLEKICYLSGDFTYTADFADLWTDWCIEAEKHPPFEDSNFDGYVGRRRAHLLKLSMVMHAARSDYDSDRDLVIDSQDLRSAIQALNEVEAKMGTAFRGVGRTDVAAMISKVVGYFQDLGVNELPYWQFARKFSTDMDKIMMDRIIQTLESSKQIVLIRSTGSTADSIIKILKQDKIVNKFYDLKAIDLDESSQSPS